MYADLTIAAVIPARDEQENVATVVSELTQLTSNSGKPLIDDIVVCDNNSSDATAERAQQAGARVVKQDKPGYGIACLTALEMLNDDVDIVVFVDADQSVDLSQTIDLLKPLREGADLVIGSRTLGSMEKGALSLPQLIGNRVAAILILLLWRTRVSDLGPFRAIRTDALAKLQMRDQTYGWTVEMQVKAIQHRLHITEIPVNTKRRAHGKSKIGGTFKGIVGASVGILSMILKLALHSSRRD